MGTKWRRYCQGLPLIIIELLICMEQWTKFLSTEPKDLYGHYKSRSLDSGDFTSSICFIMVYFNIMLQFLPVSHVPSVLFSNQNFCVVFVISSYHTTPFCCILYHIILGKEYRLWGSFLFIWFSLLLQPYEINLQLTGLVSRLAMLPHPYLHEYLLNPLLPLRSEASSLFSVLQLVAEELVIQVPAMKSYRRLLYSTRQKLLGDGSDMQ